MTDTTPTTAPPAVPAINTITKADITAALRSGMADFAKAPTYGLALGTLFSVVGIAIVWALYSGQVSYWIFPLAAGFPLVGPFAAVGLYEVSRRLETGEPIGWGAILAAGFRHGNSQLPLYAVVAVFAFLVWIVLARIIFAVSFGTASMTNVMTSFDIFMTSQGITMLIIGSVVGAALAALLFAISVVSVPMLVDRDIDVVTALITSFGAVVENKAALFYWGAIIVVAIVLAMLPIFVGMIIIFPILGHTTWHVYRQVIETQG